LEKSQGSWGAHTGRCSLISSENQAGRPGDKNETAAKKMREEKEGKGGNRKKGDEVRKGKVK